MERFAEQGIDCHAVSLRGTAGSPSESSSVKISQHVADLRAFVDEVIGVPPILVGHSFGGASVLKYLEEGGPAAGAVLVCSVPPSGNGPMVGRFLRRSLRQAWLITRGFALKAAAKDVSTARDLFFDERTPEVEVASYLPRLEADSKVGLDLGHFVRNLPSQQADDSGRALWLPDAPPMLVLGASRDRVVDREGVEETADFLGVHAEFIDLPHDVMLATGWEKPADRIIAWAKAPSGSDSAS
jgi:pimeloyl-ACP methyl ester carboxylesterase